jgi:hypothetical protein
MMDCLDPTPAVAEPPNVAEFQGKIRSLSPVDVSLDQVESEEEEERPVVDEIVASSVHQATVYLTLFQDQNGSRKMFCTRFFFLFMSFAIVYLQCAVASAINYGASKPICIDNEGCPLGWWCDTILKECLECDAEWNEKKNGGGNMCSGMSPMMLDMMWMKDEAAQSWTQRTGGKLGMPTTKQRIYMCDACEVSSRVQNNGELDSEFLDVATVFDRRIEANRHNDWAALILASFVVALAASSEVRDILLVDFYYVHQHSSGRWRGQGFFHEDSVWRLALIYLGMCMNLPPLSRCAPLITILARTLSSQVSCGSTYFCRYWSNPFVLL